MDELALENDPCCQCNTLNNDDKNIQPTNRRQVAVHSFFWKSFALEACHNFSPLAKHAEAENCSAEDGYAHADDVTLVATGQSCAPKSRKTTQHCRWPQKYQQPVPGNDRTLTVSFIKYILERSAIISITLGLIQVVKTRTIQGRKLARDWFQKTSPQS